MERRGTNVRGGGDSSVKNMPGVSVYIAATAGMQPPGKADIPQSRAVHSTGYNNNTSPDKLPIPEQEHQKPSENTTHLQRTTMELIGLDYDI